MRGMPPPDLAALRTFRTARARVPLLAGPALLLRRLHRRGCPESHAKGSTEGGDERLTTSVTRAEESGDGGEPGRVHEPAPGDSDNTTVRSGEDGSTHK